MTEMTEATRAFFQREDVREWMLKSAKRRTPKAFFCLMSGDSLHPAVYYGNDEWDWSPVRSPLTAWDGWYPNKLGDARYAEALREGRALLDQPASTNLDAFKQNLRAEVDGLHRQADLAEQQLATGLWGGIVSPIAQQVYAQQATAQQAALQGALQAQRRSVGWDTFEVGCDFTLPTRAEPGRAVCFICTQTVWDDAQHYGKPVCSDCRMQARHNLDLDHEPLQSLDARIAAARPEPVARERWDWDAWSTATEES